MGRERRTDPLLRKLLEAVEAPLAAAEAARDAVQEILRRGERGLDRLEEFPEERVGAAFSPHRAPYDTIPTRWPPAGRASAPLRAIRAASSRSARTPGACPTARKSSTPSSTPVSASPSCRSSTNPAFFSSVNTATSS